MKLALKRPIVVGDSAPVTELTFREDVVAGDMRGVAIRDPMLFDDLLRIAGRLCAQPDVVINKLSIEDMGEVVRLVSGFMAGGQETGSAR